MIDWVKALSPIVAAALALLGAALITHRVSDRYEQRRKRWEFDLITMQELTSLYGELFQIWKAWDARCRFTEVSPPDDLPWTLLNRAATAEGRLEALLLRVAADRPLREPEDIEVLGGLRQSFKIVRKAIRSERPIGWYSSENGEYAAFKNYAARTAALLASDRAGTPPSAEDASSLFLKITSNRHETTWVAKAELPP